MTATVKRLPRNARDCVALRSGVQAEHMEGRHDSKNG